jgi:hypothetical protein
MHEAIIAKFQKSVVFKADYNDIERLIEDHFGFNEYNIACEEEVGNDTSLDYDLDGELDEWDHKDIAAMLATKRPKQWRTRTLLNYLVSEKVLEPGQYIIRVSW